MNANSPSPLPMQTLPNVGTPKRKRDERFTEYQGNGNGNNSSSNIAIFFPRPISMPTTPSAETLQLDTRSIHELPSPYAEPSSSMPARDGSSSPRSRVAHRFRNLAIGGSSGDEKEPSASAADSSPTKRKRIRLLGEEPGWGGLGGSGDNDSSRSPGRRARPFSPSPSPSRLVVDALRASLTWQEDEITVYDPDDADDDGTGVNGIGFRPTPAIARARAVKRRQQLADYRKREEREARARRSLLRRTRAAAAEEEAVRVTEALALAAATADASAAPPSQPQSLQLPRPIAAHDAATPPSPTSIPTAPTSSRRVRFLDPGPTAIHFLEPEPTAVLSS